MEIVLAEDMVDQCYFEYGAHVNTQRAIPYIYDGMKTVQRRLAYSAIQTKSNKMVKSANLVGKTIAETHPHGDTTVYNTLVNLVTDSYPLFDKQGNFGFVGLTTLGAAAMRYTEVRSSRLLREVYAPYVDRVKQLTNTQGFSEPEFFPTMIPYCLLNGTSGIGVGCRTSIPPISIDSMVEFLSNGGKNFLIPKLKSGNLAMTDVQIERLNSEGVGVAVATADVTMEMLDGRMSTVIRNTPQYVKPEMLLTMFDAELEENLIYIGDIKEKNGRAIVIQRRNNIRRISDQEIFDRVVKYYKKTVSFKMVAARSNSVMQITPAQWLEECFGQWNKHAKISTENELARIALEIKFEGVREEVLGLVFNNSSLETARKQFQWDGPKTESEFFFTRPLNRYRTDDLANLKVKKASLEVELQDIPNKSIAKMKSFGRFLKK